MRKVRRFVSRMSNRERMGGGAFCFQMDKQEEKRREGIGEQ